MGRVIMCGVDLHENSMACRMAVDRAEAVTKRYGNTGGGRAQLFADLKGEARRQGCDRIVLAYEASTYGFCLYDDSREAGVACFLLAPTKMRKSHKDRKNKNDDADAQLILETLRGHVLGGNALPSIWIPDDTTRADRETVRARLDLAHKLTGVKTQVQTLLKARRIHKPREAGKSWTKPYRGWVQSLCLGPAPWPALATLLRQMETLEKEIVVLDQDVMRLAATARYQGVVETLVEKIQGVGLLTAMVFLTEMGDLSRFANRRQVGAFLGLVPTSHESGEADDRKGHITREGSARLRRVLCQGSWARVAHDPTERQVYDRLVRRNPKHKKIAVVAIMRRMGILLWHIGLDAQRRAGVFAARESAPLAAAVA